MLDDYPSRAFIAFRSFLQLTQRAQLITEIDLMRRSGYRPGIFATSFDIRPEQDRGEVR